MFLKQITVDNHYNHDSKQAEYGIHYEHYKNTAERPYKRNRLGNPEKRSETDQLKILFYQYHYIDHCIGHQEEHSYQGSDRIQASHQ